MPVPLRPKKRVVSPESSSLADECRHLQEVQNFQAAMRAGSRTRARGSGDRELESGWAHSWLRSGMRYIMSVSTPFFISPAYLPNAAVPN